MSQPIVVITHSFYLGWSESSPIGKAIQKLLPNMGLVLPHTTTRLVPVQDAYVVSEPVFDDMKERGQFLATETVLDVRHGIAADKIQDVVRSGRVPFVIMRPDPAAILRLKLGDNNMLLIDMRTSPALPDAPQVWADKIHEAMEPVLLL